MNFISIISGAIKIYTNILLLEGTCNFMELLLASIDTSAWKQYKFNTQAWLLVTIYFHGQLIFSLTFLIML